MPLMTPDSLYESGPKDSTGWRIVVGARVYRKPRPSRVATGLVPGVGGVVERIDWDPRTGHVVHVRARNGGLHSMRAFECRVQGRAQKRRVQWKEDDDPPAR